MMVTKTVHGILPNKEEATLYTLKIGQYEAQVSSYGATWVKMVAPDKHGTPGNVVLGFDDVDSYLNNTAFYGATVGRFANRIDKGTFKINGVAYHIPCNEKGINALHGGTIGFDKRNWTALTTEADGAPGVHFSLYSPDGEMGFPGHMRAYVDYVLKPSGKLEITFIATCDKKCPINLTNHAYFNLNGKGDILSHQLQLDCDRYVPVNNKTLIPSGEIKQVRHTPFDFTEMKEIGKEIAKTEGGYDHCMVITDTSDSLRRCAKVWDPVSGRTMEVFTTMPGVQFYSGNFLEGKDIGREGHAYNKHGGFCLETEHFPDAMNHPNFPNCIQEPGEQYKHKTVFKFGVE